MEGLARLLVLFPILIGGAGMASALDLTVPGEAELTRKEQSAAGSYLLPTGPFSDGQVPSIDVEGLVSRQAWRIEGEALTTLKLLVPLRDQLTEEGYEILLDCADRECGGFDFRFNTEILPAPDMFVDLFDFRFLSARKTDGPSAEYVSCLVSVTGQTGYLQLVTVGGGEAPKVEIGAVDTASPASPPLPAGTADIVDQLRSQGHVVLPDLVFDSGSSALAEGSYDSLAALAGFLNEDASRRIALVGHTDTVGGLDTNVALSRRRAASVLERLVSRYEVPRAQMESNGMGYLSPVAPNTTEAGREANRRVEAVLLNTE
ncbi:Outer membrane porin F precursor [Roseovarius indicus]|uniref:Outer membrane porin F n=2 Tax=Roseovarius indicus TaxID=540747 RepID=A0A5P3A6Z6_9RHOB|nr:Outer membrane porin F precursor [Roseovarius indicus]SFE23752.1 OmpA-OmpF porin, OOP family [Roseovarius indicus]